MSRRPTLPRLLRAARLDDPDPEVLEPVAVRVLARVAVLQSAPGAASQERRAARGMRGPRRARMAGALAAVAVLGTALFPGSDATVPAVPVPAAARGLVCPEAWAVTVSTALSGNLTSRRCLRQAGRTGRELLWQAAEQGRSGALDLLRSWGRLADQAESERAAALVLGGGTGPGSVQERALDLLVAEPGPWGVERLTALLILEPRIEGPVVGALRRLALRGAREEAVRALLAGAAAGRVAAAVAAVELGSASVADRLLVLAPAAVLASPELGAALAQARETLVARVLRRAEDGETAALAWAAQARLAGVVPLLLRQATEPDLPRASWALDRLGHAGSAEAWLAIARCTSAPAGERALALLAEAPAAACGLLAQRALESVRDRPAALWALACAGSEGLGALAQLSRRPALAPEVLAVLERAPAQGAAEVLFAMAQASDSALPVVSALSRRLAGGHAEAGRMLLRLGREGPRRAALEALLGAGEHGLPFLAWARQDRDLGDEARAVTARAAARAGAAGRPAPDGAPKPPLPTAKPARSF